MTDILMPRLTSNDDSYVLVEWLVSDGQKVTEGEEIALVDTSKATVELVSPADGIVRTLAALSGALTVGDRVGVLYASTEEFDESGKGPPALAPTAVPVSDDAGLAVTRGARELAAEHGLTDDDLRGLGTGLVRRSDVERLIAAGSSGRVTTGPQVDTGPDVSTESGDDAVRPLSRSQRAVSATVRKSHRTIPTGFVLVKVAVDEALRVAAETRRTHDVLVGIPELLVMALGSLHERFPFCYATLIDDENVVLHPAATVGVTIDTGHGLHIASVPDADTSSCAEIADRLMELRLRSVSGTFQGRDLSVSTILLSLHHERDVVHAQPIVLPGQTCAVTLAGVLDEVVLAEGVPASRKVVHLGLAYDHRVLNGAEGTRFLTALKDTLENPEALVTGVRV